MASSIVHAFAKIEEGDYSEANVRKSVSDVVRVDVGDRPKVGELLEAVHVDELLEPFAAMTRKRRNRRSREVLVTLKLKKSVADIVEDASVVVLPEGVFIQPGGSTDAIVHSSTLGEYVRETVHRASRRIPR
jgi:hypothetical protein